MAIEIKLMGSDDASALMNVAPGVFDNPIDPRMTNTFLSDSRHHLAVAVDEWLIPLTQVTATMGLAVDLKAAEHGSYP
jgi:hypothetical protein